MFALSFYGDDAGKTDENDYVVAAGLVGTVAQWDRFCADWRLQLARVDLPYFHASQFFGGSDIFVGWNTNARKIERERLLTALGGIIKDYTFHSFTTGIHVPGWVKANEEYMLEEMGFSSFPLAARLIAQRTRQWAEKDRYNSAEIEFIFDQ